ncbi:CHAD domain-containing protein [Psychromarinibacter halotolerans]|uniref:CHAD domain-containing protein n=1 Tax=Psychromarinibacter halotolerans TaxID=1775175 RepID=A0ABV7GZX8_9RHOB|nr:CHAD domain-containing protein [Psychromarinibacter halotolerans]MDF0596487.1 CHAD domain-containing protein [Psychromarinibacter halotolerans]
MPYAFLPSDDTVQHGVRRITRRQLTGALDALESPDDLHSAIHDARKACKKLRGMIRLIRPHFPHYGKENAALRDAARLLSGVRDSTAMIETYDRLAANPDCAFDRTVAVSLRDSLEDRRAAEEQDQSVKESLKAFRNALSDTRDRAAKWKLDKDGFAAIEGGLADTLKQARRSMKTARKTRAVDDFHTWRKHVKYHWYHATLLQNLWPGAFEARIEAARDLGELLGQHHDLANFQILLQDPTMPGAARHALYPPARDEMQRLEDEALALGALLLSEKPKTVASRWKTWWTLWRDT